MCPFWTDTDDFCRYLEIPMDPELREDRPPAGTCTGEESGTDKQRSGKMYWGNILVGVSMTIFFVILSLNINEAICLEDRKPGLLTEHGLAVVKKKGDKINKRVVSCLVNVIVIIVASSTSVLPFLEKGALKIVEASRLNVPYNFQLGESLFISTVALCIEAFRSASLLCFTGERIKLLLLLGSFVVGTMVGNPIILYMLGREPRWSNILRTMAVIACIIVIHDVSITVHRTVKVKEEVILYTRLFESTIQEFLDSLGKYRSFFKEVYISEFDMGYRPSISIGVFGEYDIYILFRGMKALDLGARELLGLLAHETGHCHYRVGRARFLLKMSLTILGLVFGGWFIARSKFTNWFINDDKDRDRNISTAMKYMVLCLVLYPAYVEVASVILNQFDRYSEYRADRFAVTLGYGEQLADTLDKKKKFSKVTSMGILETGCSQESHEAVNTAIIKDNGHLWQCVSGHLTFLLPSN